MAITWTKGMTPIRVEPEYIVSAPVLAAAEINLGAIVLYDKSTNHNISDEMDEATADMATVLGVALGESLAGDTRPIPVALKGIFSATLVSATYGIGDSLKYDVSADNGTLVAAAGADHLCWFWSKKPGSTLSGATLTQGYVYFDATMLSIVTSNLFALPTT